MTMDIANSDMQDTIDLVENIEFTENIQLKTEIKEEEGCDQPPPVDVKPKLEPIENSETGQAKIQKTEPEEIIGNDETETLCNESIEVKDEFMWAMKDFVSDNAPPKKMEQQIVAALEKKRAFECSLCQHKFGRKDQLNRHIAIVHEKEKLLNCFVRLSDNVPPKIIEQQIAASAAHEKKKAFQCSLCPYKCDRKDSLKKHIAGVHEKKKPYKCSLCPGKFGHKGHLNEHITGVHEKKKAFECTFCPYKCGRKGSLKTHIASVHEKKKPFDCSMCPSKFAQKGQLNTHIAGVHYKKKPFECSSCPYKCGQKVNLNKHMAVVHEDKKPSLT